MKAKLFLGACFAALVAAVSFLPTPVTQSPPAYAQGGQILPTTTFSRGLLLQTDAAGWRTSIGAGAPYSLPMASSGSLGGIRIGSGLSIDGSGIVSAAGGGSGSSAWTEATGLTGDGTTDNRATLQTQWDAAATAKKSLAILTPGTYNLTKAGANGWCLKPASTTNYYGLILGPGVNLKLANAQSTDAVPVDVIRVTDHTGGGYIGWPGGGIGGGLIGNAANQSGWTQGYVQAIGSHGIGGTDTSGQGSRNWTIEGLSITDFHSNCVNWGNVNNYGLGSRNIHIRRCFTTTCGEGFQMIGVTNCSMIDIEDIGTVATRVGDYCEFAFCQDYTADRIYAHTNGVDGVLGGAAVDGYASRRGTISNIRAYKTAQGVTLQTDFSNVANTADDVTVTNVVCVDTAYQAIFPAEGGRSTWTNIVINNCAHGVSSSVDCTATTANCRFSMSNIQVKNSRGIGAKLGVYNWSNIHIDGGAATTGYTAIGVAGSGELNWSQIRITGYQTGVEFNGSISPSGRITDVYTEGCTANGKVCVSGATLVNLQCDNAFAASNGFSPYNVNATAVADEKPWQGYPAFYGVSGASMKTLAQGSRNQILKIHALFGGFTINDYRTGPGAGGNFELTGGADAALTVGSVIYFKFDPIQANRWQEISRSIR